MLCHCSGVRLSHLY